MVFDSNPEYVLALGATYLAICPLFVALRFSARAVKKVGFGVDDWLTIPALLMLMGCAINFIIGVRLKVYGYPTPPPTIPAEQHNSLSYNFTKAEQLQYAFLPMHILSMGCIKLSFIFLFRRIFITKGTKTRFNAVSIVAIVVILAWTAAFVLWFLFNCGSHFTARWHTLKSEREACPTALMSTYGMAISDFITDLMIIVLPFPLVLRLNMQPSRKIAILGAFSLGALALAASVTRFGVFIHKELQSNQALTHQNIDQLLVLTSALYWSLLENGLALMACCLPTLNIFTQSKLWVSGSRTTRNFFSSQFSRSRSSHQQPSHSGSVSDASTLEHTTTSLSLHAKRSISSSSDTFLRLPPVETYVPDHGFRFSFTEPDNDKTTTTTTTTNKI